MTNDEKDYISASVKSTLAVCDEKPLAIISAGKSLFAFQLCEDIARTQGKATASHQYRCEDGQKHAMLFVGQRSWYIQDAVNLISSHQRGSISRPELQWKIGGLLGYEQADRLEFIASAISRTCPCDICGGPFVSEAYFYSTLDREVVLKFHDEHTPDPHGRRVEIKS